MSQSKMSFETQITEGEITDLFPDEVNREHFEQMVTALWKGFSGRVKVVLEQDDDMSNAATKPQK